MQDKNVIKLTEQDAVLLEQAASMLEGLENDERNRGNCSTAEGAGCSAHAVRRLASALLAHEREIGQCLHQIAEPTHPTACTVEEVRAFEAAAAPAAGAVPDAVRAALFAARGALQHLIDGGKPTESLFNAAIQAIDSAALTAAAPGAVAVPDERAAFEAWFLQKGSAHQLERNEAKGWYENAWANAGWEAWQARAALAAAPAAVPVALTIPQPFGYVVTTPAGADFFYRHPADLAIHNDHRAETVYTMPAVLAAAPVVLPEPSAAIKEVMGLVSDWRMKEHFSAEAQLDAQGSEATPVDEDRAKRCWIEEREAWQAVEAKLRALLAGVSAPPAQAVVQTPVLYVSKEQLDSHRDPDGPDSFGAGRYLPARITPKGKFATPLFAVPASSFQARVQPWLLECFGEMIAGDREERNHRFLEESLELVQSLGCTASEAHQLVDYVYGRPWGEPAQEAGGVMVTLAALCLANGLDMHTAGEVELARIWTKVEAIRAKQAAKPKHSPLPEAPAVDAVTIPVSALRDLRKDHIYMGLCPEDSQPDSRDPDCPCCKATVIVDAAIAAQAAAQGEHQ